MHLASITVAATPDGFLEFSWRSSGKARPARRSRSAAPLPGRCLHIALLQPTAGTAHAVAVCAPREESGATGCSLVAYSLPLPACEEAVVDGAAAAGGEAGGAVGFYSIELPAASAAPWTCAASAAGSGGGGGGIRLVIALGGRGGSSAFVPVSKRPGTTARLDFYGVGSGAATSPLVLVDTPGYGFSSRGKAARSWPSCAIPSCSDG
jgi:hypothetical protein